MKVDTLPKNQLKKNVPALRAGQVVRVHERIKEGGKERTQVFEGLVLAVKHGKGLDGTFTVRKIGAGNIGVERIFPLHMPAIEKIEVLRQERVRRSKLYYVRRQVGQKVKKRKTKLENLMFDMGATLEEEPEVTEEGEVPENEEVAEDTTTDAPKQEEASKEEEVEPKTEEKSEEPEATEDAPEENTETPEEKAPESTEEAPKDEEEKTEDKEEEVKEDSSDKAPAKEETEEPKKEE